MGRTAEREVTLAEMLLAREERAARQQRLLTDCGQPVVSFTMNIAGPVKNGPLIRRAFQEGLRRLTDGLEAARLPVVAKETVDEVTGCEAVLSVRGDAGAVKRLCVELEDEDPLGRLFDLDVLAPGGEKLDREAFGHPPRPCLICGKPGKGCASRRLHPVEQLRAATGAVMRGFFAGQDARAIAAQAVRALTYEVCTTPKPGLVDRTNNGSHQDMDVFTFLDSTAAISPYLLRAVELGQKTAGCPPEETFRRLRAEGLEAERAMFRATAGVNTHKGAVFSMGILCAAAGRLWTPEDPWPAAEAAGAECAAMSRKAVEEDLARLGGGEPQTGGQRLFMRSGLRGVRGEAADGMPSVLETGLPALRRALEAGASLEQAGTAALLAFVARVDDSNLYARGGEEGRSWAAEAAGAALSGPIPKREVLEALDREFIRRRLSPGGCADLLAATYFLCFCERERKAQTDKTE